MNKMDDFLPLENQVLKGLKAMAMPPGLLGLAQTLETHQHLLKTFESPFLEATKNLSSMTAIFGLTAAFQQHHNFAKAFTVPSFEFPPSLSQVIKQHMGLTESVAEAMKKLQPFDLGIANQLKAMELSTHFSSLVIPKGLIESLRDIDHWSDDTNTGDDVTGELDSIISSPGNNPLEALDKIQSILDIIRAQITKLITSTTDATERAMRLVTYDRVINHLGIVLSVLMYFVQAADQAKTDKRIASIAATVDRIEQKLVQPDNQVLQERVCDIQNDLQAVMTMIAEPDLRVCVKQTPLKNSPVNSAATLGVVEEYQLVSVVKLPEEQKKKKWIYITYFDNHTGEPKAGWVPQKYFKRNKVNRHF